MSYRAIVTLTLATLYPSTPARAQAPIVDLIAPTEARTPEEEKAGFHLPPGFEAQLVAAEPDIAKPMNLSFDDMRRLWVTSSYEYPFPAKDGTPPRDKVTILSDFASNGRARKVTTFADGLNIPIGVLPLSPNGALVHSIPNIYHMIDEDGDERADFRDLFYGSIGFRDTHGMASAFTMGFDGWIYACHGFANDSTLKGRDGQAIVLNSGNTIRLKPNGTHDEQFTWGQVNPFGLTFDPLGNIYSTDCHTKPIYQLLRGAYYDSFGKPHDGLGYGPDMMSHDHYSTGIAGIVYYAADGFPQEFRDNIFVGNVVTSRINRDRLEYRGSSPWAVAMPDFMTSEDPWFRPVDIELGPDGALYVADFYNCIIGHYEVDINHPRRDRHRGRIWRIVYTGDDAKATPAPNQGDFTKADHAELIGALKHPNLAVRLRATSLLSAHTNETPILLTLLEVVQDESADIHFRTHALWVLHRLGAQLEPMFLSLSENPTPEGAPFRVHAMRILAEGRDFDSSGLAIAHAALSDPEPLVRRCAAEVLGRHPRPNNLRPLLALRHSTDPADTHLLYVTRMALRDQFRDGAGFKALADEPEKYTEADHRSIADIMPGVHTPESARFLLAHIAKIKESPENVTKYEQAIARYGDGALAQKLTTFARDHDPQNAALQAAQLRAIHRGLQERAAKIPDEVRAWSVELAESLLTAPDDNARTLGCELAGEFRLNETRDALTARCRDRSVAEDRRVKALQALLAIDPAPAIETLTLTLLDPEDPITLREQATNLLGQSGRPEARAKLIEALTTVPARLQTAIASVVAADRRGAEALLEAITQGKASPRLLQLPPVTARLKTARIPDLDARLAKLTEGLPPAHQAIQEQLQARLDRFKDAQPNATKGAGIFTKTCATCHQLAGQGAKVGPQLDGIGIRGPERLVEDILDPNRNVDQAFRATTLALDDGRVLTGLVLREEGELVILADAEGKEQPIPKSSIEERSVAPLSPMPANIAEQLSEPDFQALLAYLLTQRQKPDLP